MNTSWDWTNSFKERVVSDGRSTRRDLLTWGEKERERRERRRDRKRIRRRDNHLVC
jgi:hypothetical protein